MHSLSAFFAVVAGLLVIPSTSAPAVAPTDHVQKDPLKTVSQAATNVSGLHDFELDPLYKFDDYDDEDNFAFLDEVQSLNQSLKPMLSQAAPLTYLDCTGIEDLCDANCYAILCLNQPRILTKVSQAQARVNRRQCGAKPQPFKGTTAQLAKRGLRRPGAQYVSAEEYPYASTAQGGRGADLFPALVSEQNIQRDALRNMYADNGIGVGDNFNLQFSNANTLYCNALARGDYSVCNKGSGGKGPGGFDNGLYAFIRDSLKNQKLHFSFVGK